MVSKAHVWLVHCSKVNWFILLSPKCVPKQMGNDSNWQKKDFPSPDGESIDHNLKFLILWEKELGNDSCVLEMPQHTEKMTLALPCKRE